MVEKKTVIRSVAIVGMLGASGLFFAQSMLGSSQGQAQTTDPQIVETEDSAQAAPVRLQPPEIDANANVRLPAQAAVVNAPIPAPVPVSIPVPASAPAQVADLIPEAAPQHLPAADPRSPQPVEVSDLGLPCGLTISATAMPGAMVAVDVMDPCQANARVELEHAGIVVTAMTDAMGLLAVDVPAFETPALFSVTMADAANKTTVVGIPDLREYDRVGVTWEGDRELELHAMELGAEFGGPGHIWDMAPGQVDDAVAGQGGFLIELGDASVEAARMAQIYTFPRAGLSVGDGVRLSVDAPITDGNCGQPVVAESLQIIEGGPITQTPISLTLPGCDAVGDYLVLQNLFQDLRIASN